MLKVELENRRCGVCFTNGMNNTRTRISLKERPSRARRTSVMIVLLAAFCLFQTVSSQPHINDDTFFISHIFEKYGNKKVITFEGLEHLMESLGLGGLDFKKHDVSLHKTEDGEFQEVHHSLNVHDHNHERKKRSLAPEEKCLRAEELLSVYGVTPGHDVEISPESFKQMCPAIVYQLDNKVCAEKVTRPPIKEIYEKDYKAWIYGVASVLVMSVCGLLGVLLVPLLEKSIFQKLLSLLGALAVGTLAGDALLHLLPHALQIKDASEETVVLRSAVAFGLIMLFFMIEAVILHQRRTKALRKDPGEESLAGHSHGNDGMAVAWMVMSGDGLHNLTDGLAIGAAFSQGPTTGLATSLAVLTHELPHELGDFAILLQTGMKIKKAIFYNILSSVMSLFGVLAGLWLGEFEDASFWIYSGTAGTFLYISLATLVPEMHKHCKTVFDIILVLGGMFIGGGIMLVIAMYEHALHEILGGEEM